MSKTLMCASAHAHFISRAGIMYADDDQLDKQLRSTMFSLSGTGFFGAIGRSINLGGQTALALRLLLAAFSSKISSDTNRPFGDEFRAARKVSEEIGAQIVLGDRPIEITLQRAWKALNWTQKLSLLKIVIGGITSSSDISTNKLELQKASTDDGTLQLYEQLRNLRFRDLAGKNSSDGGSGGWLDDLVKSLVRDTIIGIVLWALYELVKGASFPIFHDS
ncbi:hypothetical protein TSUD_45120 [Trifolium subterraneum]|nr:hypothetical protein TSUD_45120 [Trifolium subterraneum]